MTMPDKGPASPPFLGSLADTTSMIEQLREEHVAIELQKRDLDAKSSDLAARISAFNTLRQAHGLPPL